MTRNMNFESHLSALLFLGAVVGLFVAGLVLVFFLARGQRARARVAGGLVLAGGALYAGLVLAFSMASRESLLSRGEEKYFCELDCHLAYSVTGVEHVATLGEGGNRVEAKGEFYVVRVRCRFDETTTSPARGREALNYPNPRRVRLRARDGRQLAPSSGGAAALASMGTAGAPLDQPLRPGESYESAIVFDVPRDFEQPRLFLGDGDFMGGLMVGSETSPLHRKAWFAL